MISTLKLDKNKKGLLLTDLIFEDDEKDILVNHLEEYLVYGEGHIDGISNTLGPMQLPVDLLERAEKSFRVSKKNIHNRMVSDPIKKDSTLINNILAIYNNAIGVVQFLQGRFEESLRFFKNALLYSEECESAKLNLCLATVQTLEQRKETPYRSGLLNVHVSHD